MAMSPMSGCEFSQIGSASPVTRAPAPATKLNLPITAQSEVPEHIKKILGISSLGRYTWQIYMAHIHGRYMAGFLEVSRLDSKWNYTTHKLVGACKHFGS